MRLILVWVDGLALQDHLFCINVLVDCYSVEVLAASTRLTK